ncbi:hypothetical protein QVD17_00021 [Tagetes erecta]|uniref:Uncharacterized protein n=1 Tax=Tagetes erecta TaxID=13708 RepID=A0AAD8L2K9_TARER|nr:hypothetical protein QVD17_00021 [Tagetes erecta]
MTSPAAVLLSFIYSPSFPITLPHLPITSLVVIVIVLVQDDKDNEHNGIARKVVNIDGIPLLLSRGKFFNANPVMESQDELAEKVHVSKCDFGSLEKDKSKDSYAASLQSNPLIKHVNFQFLDTLEKQQGVDVVLPREPVKMVQHKLAFTLL